MNRSRIAVQLAMFLVLIVLAACVSVVRAQNADELTPAAGAAKAKDVLEQAIAALGGPAYLNVHNSDCSGRYAQFEHSGEVGGYIVFRDYKEMPDKNRMEYDPKATIVDLYVGNQGWTLDRSGVSEEPASVMADYQEQLRTDMNTILRFRMDDSSLFFRFGGSEVVDLKLADWAEIVDHEGHTIRIAIDRATHLPIRSVVINHDAEGQRIERSASFTTYHSIDGIQTPFQVSRFRNGQQNYQAFYDSCKYNTNLPPDWFTRASLDAHFSGNRKNNKK